MALSLNAYHILIFLSEKLQWVDSNDPRRGRNKSKRLSLTKRLPSYCRASTKQVHLPWNTSSGEDGRAWWEENQTRLLSIIVPKLWLKFMEFLLRLGSSMVLSLYFTMF